MAWEKLMRKRMKSIPRQTLCTGQYFTLVRRFLHTHTLCVCVSTYISYSSMYVCIMMPCDDTRICSLPHSPLPPSAIPPHCASHLHMSASYWRCPSPPLEALSNLSGLAHTELKMPPLFSATNVGRSFPIAQLSDGCVCASGHYGT